MSRSEKQRKKDNIIVAQRGHDDTIDQEAQKLPFANIQQNNFNFIQQVSDEVLNSSVENVI